MEDKQLTMEQINVGVIGTGWCGGIRSRASAESALVGDLHIAEINPERLEEVSAECRVASATTDYHTLLAREDVAAVRDPLLREPRGVCGVENLPAEGGCVEVDGGVRMSVRHPPL